MLAQRDQSIPALPFVVGLGTMILAAHTSGISAVYPSLAESLVVSIVRGQWILTIYTLALTGCLLASGSLADRFGLKRIYTAGMIVFGVSSGACALASGPLVLILLRAIEGFGAAMVSATSVAMIGADVPRRRLGSAVGWQTGITYAGLMAGPILAAYLLGRFGWRALFAVNLPIVAIAVVLAAKLPGELTDPRSRSDGIQKPSLKAFAVNGITGAVADESVFYLCLHAIGFLIPIYLTRVQALSTTEAGVLIALQNAARALTAPFSGWLSDRIGERALVLGGTAFLIASACAMYLFRADSPVAVVAAALALLGAGAGLFAPANSKALFSGAYRNQYGAAAGMLATARNFGMAAGVATAALLYAQFGGAAGTLATLAALRPAFAVVAAVAILYAALRRRALPALAAATGTESRLEGGIKTCIYR
jgi:MFS family permease